LFDKTRALLNTPAAITRSSAPPAGGTVFDAPTPAVLVPFQGGVARDLQISPTLPDSESAPEQENQQDRER
jgi:hypothetical protein